MKPAPTSGAMQAEPSDQARADAEALTERVRHTLERVNRPAHPGTLIEIAERSGASRDVIDSLRRLPDEAFGSLDEVSASIIAAQLRAHTPR